MKPGENNEYVQCTLPKGGMGWVAHSQRLRDFLRPRRLPEAKPDGNLEVRGD